jgi:quinol---cytochrome-c reductase cytochrome c subunit
MTDDSSSDFVDADREYGFEPVVSDNLEPSGDRVRRPRRRRGLRRRLAGFALLIATLGVVGGGYALIAPTSGAADTTSSSSDIATGRQLFNTSCITCHGANLQGVQGRGPTLVGVGSASVYFQVSTGRMPAPNQGAYELRKPNRFTEQQTRQLAAFVQSVGGGPQTPPPDENLQAGSAKLADGGELFRLNCASCHGATGHGAPLSAGKIAPSLMEANDSQIYTAMLSGPENMPVFGDNQLTPDEKRSIINYVQTIKTQADPGGAGVGRVGPVAEGLVIWVVGVGALLFAIFWMGTKA